MNGEEDDSDKGGDGTEGGPPEAPGVETRDDRETDQQEEAVESQEDPVPPLRARFRRSTAIRQLGGEPSRGDGADDPAQNLQTVVEPSPRQVEAPWDGRILRGKRWSPAMGGRKLKGQSARRTPRTAEFAGPETEIGVPARPVGATP